MPTPLPVTRRAMTANCLASLFWSFNFGLGAPLASLWLQDHGHSATVIGLNTGVYYLGIALAAGVVPWMMRRFGRGCPVLGMVISGLTVAFFPWGGGILGWFVLRLLNGVGGQSASSRWRRSSTTRRPRARERATSASTPSRSH